ncbi:BatA domain-containing protein [Kordiimonas sp.]|uniref:BatA domain-containing protein n=1 Tax=Kordiimonas sp. TaxID=1970157 RepID=UPI003A91E024
MISSKIAERSCAKMITAFSDISFLNAGASLAFLTLLIPILIHLFNRSPGLRVVVGSIELIKRAKARRVTEIKLMQYILLLLRLIIFSLLALVLMGLASRAFFQVPEGTAYVSPAWVAEANEDEITQLQNDHAGSDIFLLDSALTPLSTSVIAEVKAGGVATQLDGQSGAILLAALSAKKHSDNTHVYVTDLSGEYTGTAPGNWPLNWHIKESSFTPEQTKTPIALTVFTDPATATDTALIERAAIALNRHRNVDISLNVTSSETVDGADISGADWVFWLSPTPVPDTLLGTGSAARFLTYGRERAGAIMQGQADVYPFTRLKTRRIAPSPSGGEVLWTAETGEPLLTRTVQSGKEVYHLLAGFSSSSLGAAPDFAELFLQILTSPEGSDGTFSHAPVTIARGTDEAKNLPAFTYPQMPRTDWLLLMLVVFWVLERWLSERASRDA